MNEPRVGRTKRIKAIIKKRGQERTLLTDRTNFWKIWDQFGRDLIHAE